MPGVKRNPHTETRISIHIFINILLEKKKAFFFVEEIFFLSEVLKFS